LLATESLALLLGLGVVPSSKKLPLNAV